MAMLNRIIRILQMIGINPVQVVQLANFPRFIGDWHKYSKTLQKPEFKAKLWQLYPILTDYTAQAGYTQDHYFYQDIWAAKRIFSERPYTHIDIGSRIDGFIAHLLVFMKVTQIDFRPLDNNIPGLTFIRDDATMLRSLDDRTVHSLSSLHAAEHFGLGRYCDPVNPNACFQFIESLQRVLAPRGRLYFAVPVGKERVEFNAHRVFSPSTILDAFDALQLVSFSAVDDAMNFHESVDPEFVQDASYSCGLFEFRKPENCKN